MTITIKTGQKLPKRVCPWVYTFDDEEELICGAPVGHQETFCPVHKLAEEKKRGN